MVQWEFFENKPFQKGTREVLKCLIEITKNGVSTIVGGGDTATAAQKFGGEGKVTHISTGGGASLELLEGKELPGVVALSSK
jgi:phosphoglycerate kinase